MNKHPFNDTELLELFEAASTALKTTPMFYEIAEQLDLRDEYLEELQRKLQKFLDAHNH